MTRPPGAAGYLSRYLWFSVYVLTIMALDETVHNFYELSYRMKRQYTEVNWLEHDEGMNCMVEALKDMWNCLGR